VADSVSPALLIGVISDTHGLLRPEAVQALRGCSSIIHAGDVGKLEILDQLRRVAPVTAVRGNVDVGDEFAALPERVIVTIAEHRVCVLHDLAQLGCDPRAEGYSAVITGHSHVPRIEQRDGVLYLNPGAAGPRRFKLPITLAHLTVEHGQLQARLVDIGTPLSLLPPPAGGENTL
jgi:putative phosphoesterase